VGGFSKSFDLEGFRKQMKTSEEWRKLNPSKKTYFFYERGTPQSVINIALDHGVIPIQIWK
jgi:hypothetical protein